MRAQAMEKLLILFEEAVKEEDMPLLKNLRAKSIVLRDRSSRSSSVIKELIEK